MHMTSKVIDTYMYTLACACNFNAVTNDTAIAIRCVNFCCLYDAQTDKYSSVCIFAWSVVVYRHLTSSKPAQFRMMHVNS